VAEVGGYIEDIDGCDGAIADERAQIDVGLGRGHATAV
jgi:hypothetical protein